MYLSWTIVGAMAWHTGRQHRIDVTDPVQLHEGD